MEKRTFMYTEGDARKEANCHSTLLVVKRVCEDFREQLISETSVQANIIESLWELSQRYLLLHRSIPSFTTYPKVITNRVDQEILHKINKCLKEIRISNDSLQTSLKQIKQTIVEFNVALKRVDPRCGSPFIDGSTTRRPIYFYIDMLRDVYYYLRKTVSKLVFGERFIDYTDPKTIEVYKNLINQPSRDKNIVNLILS